MHELPLESIPETAQWSENYAFSLGSAEHGIGMLHSTGRWNADPTVWREVVALALPGGRIVGARNYGRTVRPDGPGASLTHLAVIEPGRRLRFRYDGPVTDMAPGSVESNAPRRCVIDLHFEGTHPIWDMRGDSAAAESVAGSLHIEQIGATSGRIEYDGEVFEITDGYSARDHSRGVRDMSRYGAHCWFNGSLSDGFAFHLYGMDLRDAALGRMANAAVRHGGDWIEAEVTEISFLDRLDALEDTVEVVLSSALGERRLVARPVPGTAVYLTMTDPYDMLLGMPRGRGQMALCDQLVEFSSAGAEGVGWTDRGFLVTDEAQLVVARSEA